MVSGERLRIERVKGVVLGRRVIHGSRKHAPATLLVTIAGKSEGGETLELTL
jgi:hypothetical protein